MKLKRIATRLTVALLISAMFMLNVSAGLVYAADDASAESTAISVSDVFDCATGEEVVVEGVFVGVSFADTSDSGDGNITHSVSTYSQENSTDLTTFASDYIDAEKTFSSSIEMARALYNEALGVNLKSYESVGAMLDELIDERNNTCRTDTELSKMIVPHLFGGVNIRAGHYSIPDNERTRLLSEEELSVGDIIGADWVYIEGEKL